MTKATLTKTRSGAPRTPDPRAVAVEVEALRAEVRGIKRVLSPPFAAPKEKHVDGPRQNGSGNRVDWSRYPDHDPDYLAGKITLEQAKVRHPRPDTGCKCPNCDTDRKRDAHQRQPTAEFTPARCVICMGSGFRGRPEAMGWASCTACGAEEFFRLAAESYQGGTYSAPSLALVTARGRVEACEECHGSGKVWQPIPASPCPACKGTGADNHVKMPPGVLWPRADGGIAEDTSSGQAPPQQVTMWSQVPEPEAMPDRVTGAIPEGDAPWAIARGQGIRMTQPRGY